MPPLNQILAALEQHSSRCTYGALADFIGEPAQALLGRHPRDSFHRWIVAATGDRQDFPNIDYPPALITEDRYLHSPIINTSGELEDFLRRHGLL